MIADCNGTEENILFYGLYYAQSILLCLSKKSSCILILIFTKELKKKKNVLKYSC